MHITDEQSKIKLSEYNECLIGVVCPLRMIIGQGQGLSACISPYKTLMSQGSTPYLGMTVKQSNAGSRSLDLFNSPAFIEKIISGDDYAFRELAHDMILRLPKFVFNTFQYGQYPLSKSDAEDVAQETMFRVGRAIRDGEYNQQPDAKFTTWIFTIARNLAYSRYNQLKKRNEVPLSIQDSNTEDQPFSKIKKRKRAGSSESGEDIAILWSDPIEKLHIEQVLQSLKEKYRDVLIWVYIDDQDPEEIAEREGVHLDTVYQWLSRGRKQFKQAYAKL